MKKKALSVFLTLCFCMMMFPLTAYAENNPYPEWNDKKATITSCTWKAWQMVYDEQGIELPGDWGHAKDWYYHAPNKGSEPEVGAIACWAAASENDYFGHVAYVLDVYDDGSIHIIEGGSTFEDSVKGIGERIIERDEKWPTQGFIYTGGSGGHNPKAWLDTCEGGAGCIKVQGWAFDIDDLSFLLDVHVYIDSEPGDVGADCHSIKADKYRPDVNDVFGCGNYHGFDDTIYTDKTGQHEVRFYALNIYEGRDYIQIGETQYVNIKSSSKKSKAAITFSPWNDSKYTYIGETDASLGHKITVSGAKCTSTGMYLYDASNNLLAKASNPSYTGEKIYFKVNEECGYTLKPGTKYKYRFYAVVNGKKYWSPKRYVFTTIPIITTVGMLPLCLMALFTTMTVKNTTVFIGKV